MSDEFDNEVEASEAVKASPLADMIKEFRDQKAREEKAKVAGACFEIYERAEKHRESLHMEYLDLKRKLEEKLHTLKELTSVIKGFEQTCDPFPLLQIMGVDKAAFCRKNGIKG